jgi:anti-sigma-K factor RskA
MTDHPELENAVAAYVLGAAEPDELEGVRAHLAGCDDCRAVAARLQRAVDELPMAVGLIAPPAHLKANILTAAAAPLPSQTAPSDVAQTRVRRTPPTPNRWSFLVPLAPRPSGVAIAVLALVVLGLGGWNLWLAAQLSQGRPQVAQITLTGSGSMAGAQAKVVDLRDQGVALVSFSHLPRLSADHVYEVWLITADGHPEAAAVFQPDADGGKTLVIGKDIRLFKVIAVTVEAGPDGTAAPSQAPGLSGNTI